MPPNMMQHLPALLRAGKLIRYGHQAEGNHANATDEHTFQNYNAQLCGLQSDVGQGVGRSLRR